MWWNLIFQQNIFEAGRHCLPGYSRMRTNIILCSYQKPTTWHKQSCNKLFVNLANKSTLLLAWETSLFQGLLIECVNGVMFYMWLQLAVLSPKLFDAVSFQRQRRIHVCSKANIFKSNAWLYIWGMSYYFRINSIKEQNVKLHYGNNVSMFWRDNCAKICV